MSILLGESGIPCPIGCGGAVLLRLRPLGGRQLRLPFEEPAKIGVRGESQLAGDRSGFLAGGQEILGLLHPVAVDVLMNRLARKACEQPVQIGGIISGHPCQRGQGKILRQVSADIRFDLVHDALLLGDRPLGVRHGRVVEENLEEQRRDRGLQLRDMRRAAGILRTVVPCKGRRFGKGLGMGDGIEGLPLQPLRASRRDIDLVHGEIGRRVKMNPEIAAFRLMRRVRIIMRIALVNENDGSRIHLPYPSTIAVKVPSGQAQHQFPKGVFLLMLFHPSLVHGMGTMKTRAGLKPRDPLPLHRRRKLECAQGGLDFHDLVSASVATALCRESEACKAGRQNGAEAGRPRCPAGTRKEKPRHVCDICSA